MLDGRGKCAAWQNVSIRFRGFDLLSTAEAAACWLASCQRTRAKVLAMHGSRNSRLAAVQILKNSSSIGKPRRKIIFAAQVHDALNDWTAPAGDT
jgi:hypothetical protein